MLKFRGFADLGGSVIWVRCGLADSARFEMILIEVVEY